MSEPDDPIDYRRAFHSLRSILSALACDAFTHADLRFKPNKALLYQFRAHDDHVRSLLLWAPANYVGVFTKWMQDDRTSFMGGPFFGRDEVDEHRGEHHAMTFAG